MSSAPLSQVISDQMPSFLLQSGFSASWAMDNITTVRTNTGKFYTNVGSNNPYKKYSFGDLLLTESQFEEFLVFWKLVLTEKVFWFIDPLDNQARLTREAREFDLGFYTRGALFAENTQRGTGTGFNQTFTEPDTVVPVKVYGINTTRGHTFYCKPIYRLQGTSFDLVPGNYGTGPSVETVSYSDPVDFTDPQDYLITNIPYGTYANTDGGGVNGQRLEPAEFDFYTPIRFDNTPTYTKEINANNEVVYNISGLTATEIHLPIPGYPKSGFSWYADFNYSLGDTEWSNIVPRNFDDLYFFPVVANASDFLGQADWRDYNGSASAAPQWSIASSEPNITQKYYGPDLKHIYLGTRAYSEYQLGHNFRLDYLLTFASTTEKVLDKRSRSISGLLNVEARDEGIADISINTVCTKFEMEYLTTLAYCSHFGGNEFILDNDYTEYRDIDGRGVPMARFRELSQTIEIDDEDNGTFAYSVAFTLGVTGYGNLSVAVDDTEPISRGNGITTDERYPVANSRFTYEAFFRNNDDHQGRRIEGGTTSFSTEGVGGSSTPIGSAGFQATAAANDWFVVFTDGPSQTDLIRYDFNDGGFYFRFNRLPNIAVPHAHIYQDKVYYSSGNIVYVFDRYAQGERPAPGVSGIIDIPQQTLDIGELVTSITSYRGKIYVTGLNGIVYVGDGCDWYNLYTLTLSGVNIIHSLIYAEKIWVLTNLGLERHNLATGAFENLISNSQTDSTVILQRSFDRLFVLPRFDNTLIAELLDVYDISNDTVTSIDTRVEVTTTGRGFGISGLAKYSINEEMMVRSDDVSNLAIIRFNFRGNNISTFCTQVLAISEGTNAYRMTSDYDMPIPNFRVEQMPQNTLAGTFSGQINDTSLTPASQEFKADFSPNNAEMTVSSDFLPNYDASGAGQPYYTAYLFTLDRRYLGDHNLTSEPETGRLSIFYTFRGTLGDIGSSDDENELTTLQVVGEEIYWTKKYNWKTSSGCGWLFGDDACGLGAVQRSHLVSARNPSTDPYSALMISATDANAPETATIGAFTYGSLQFVNGQNVGLTIPIARIYTGSNTGQAYATKGRPGPQGANPGNVNIDLLYAPPFPVADDTSVLLIEGCFRTQEACVAKGNKLRFSGFTLVPGIGKFARGTADSI